MRSGWAAVALRDICSIEKGASPTLKTRPGRYPLIVTGPVPASADTYQFDGEAVCVPLVSSTGHGHASLKRVHYASGRFAVANIVAACLPQDREVVNTRYLWLYLDHFKDEVIVRRMKGTANVSLSVGALGTVPVVLPPLPEQQRIVDLISLVDAALRARDESASTASAVVTNLRARLLAPSDRSIRVRIGDLVTKVTVPLTVERDVTYTEVGVRSHGRGVFIKEPVTGEALGNKKVFRLTPGCLVFNIVFAWEGAVSVLGPEAEGKIASHRFPTYAGRGEHSVGLLNEFFRTFQGRELLQLCSPGGAGRNRTLNQGGLFSSAAALPPVEQWAEVVTLIAAARDCENRAVEARDALRTLRSGLLAALLSGEHQIPESYDALLEAS